jgi:hypothetical protein
MDDKLVEMTAKITKQYVSNHRLDVRDIEEFISGVHKALWDAANPKPQPEPEVTKARKATRRKAGQIVALNGKPEVSKDIVDAEEAKSEIIEEIVEDNFNEVVEDNEIPEEENILGEIKQDNEIDLDDERSWSQPEPMFEE